VCRESETGTVFEYLVNESTGAWQHWAGCVPEWTYPYADEKPKFAQLVIPTLDSVRCVGSSALGALLTLQFCLPQYQQPYTGCRVSQSEWGVCVWLCCCAGMTSC
jgi:hypothetical protein